MSPLSRIPRRIRSGRLAPRTRAGRIAVAGVLCAAVTGGALELGALGDPDAATGSADSAGSADDAAAGPAPGTPAAAAHALTGIPAKERPPRGPGLNFLLVGLDRRVGLSSKMKNALHVNGKQCDCTDVMMLLHVSADRRRVSVVSIPRDSYVRFAAHHDTGKGVGKDPRHPRHLGKINSAYAHGGPQLTVRTVEQATGVRIDHYAETDFLNFTRTVDRLGGARVCSAKPLRDDNSGLRLPAGTHRLNGRHALRYVRARHVDPPGDLGRVRRQQRLVGELLTTLTGDRVAGDPAAALRMAAALHGTSVRTDAGLTRGTLVRLGRELRGLTPHRTEFATVPLSEFDHRAPEWGSSLVWDKSRARALFGDLRADRPITRNPRTQPADGKQPVATSPKKITVRVRGGGAVGRRMANQLRAQGFHVLDPAHAGDGPKLLKGATRISFDRHWDREAPTLGTALPGARLSPFDAKPGKPGKPSTSPKPGKQGQQHSPVFTVRPGTTATRVVGVVEDRSSVEGAPVTGDRLHCGADPAEPPRR